MVNKKKFIQFQCHLRFNNNLIQKMMHFEWHKIVIILVDEKKRFSQHAIPHSDPFLSVTLHSVTQFRRWLIDFLTLTKPYLRLISVLLDSLPHSDVVQ